MTNDKPSLAATGRMVDAANQLLDALDDGQREAATWPFPADEERRQWFYTPTDHGGLRLAAMDARQQQLVHRLLAVGLSRAGYNTASLVIASENLLDYVEGFSVTFGRDRGRDPTLYWIAVFGTPSNTGAWGWRFGGHHISLNYTMVDGSLISATPSFFGADPAAVPLLGPHMHRPLAAVEDLGRELARSFGQEQASAALISPVAPQDLISSNRPVMAEGDRPRPMLDIWRGRLESEIAAGLQRAEQQTMTALGVEETHLERLAFTAAPKGLAARNMNADQKEVMHQLLMTYIGRIHDDLADEQAAKFTGEAMDDLHFLWAGGLELGDPHYYRMQGGDLLVEFDNAQRGGNHIHSVWRDLSADFGGDPLAEHYTSGHDH